MKNGLQFLVGPPMVFVRVIGPSRIRETWKNGRLTFHVVEARQQQTVERDTSHVSNVIMM